MMLMLLVLPPPQPYCYQSCAPPPAVALTLHSPQRHPALITRTAKPCNAGKLAEFLSFTLKNSAYSLPSLQRPLAIFSLRDSLRPTTFSLSATTFQCPTLTPSHGGLRLKVKVFVPWSSPWTICRQSSKSTSSQPLFNALGTEGQK